MLDRPDDVFHLHVDELRLVAADRGDRRPLVTEREAELEAQALLEPPPFLGAPPVEPLSVGDPGERPPMAESGPDELVDTAASPGVVTGTARVVADRARVPGRRAG